MMLRDCRCSPISAAAPLRTWLSAQQPAALSSSVCRFRNVPRRLGGSAQHHPCHERRPRLGATRVTTATLTCVHPISTRWHTRVCGSTGFYSASPVCSPTRGSCLTGRHPYRYGIFHANSGDGASFYPLPPEELTLAEALKPLGYASGHFGKWHLGDFQGEKKSSPSDNGFDEWFSTVRKTPTYDPEGYWSNGEPVTDLLEGDDSTHIVSRALGYIRRKVDERRPFFVDALVSHTPLAHHFKGQPPHHLRRPCRRIAELLGRDQRHG